jgi:hypothetical protein
MNVVPFYGFQYKGKYLNRDDQDTCREFNGDCYLFVKKYLRLEWFVQTITAETGLDNAEDTVFDGHACTEEEVTKDIYA